MFASMITLVLWNLNLYTDSMKHNKQKRYTENVRIVRGQLWFCRLDLKVDLSTQ